MKETGTNDGIIRYLNTITRLQIAVIETQLDTLGEVAGKMAKIISQDGRIFLFGTGHSHILTEEAFYRAGGIPATVPMFAPMILMVHESARLSSQMERMKELATPILDEYEPQAGEMLIVYADSGSNELPVQMAIEAKERGLIVVGVCSFKYAKIAPETVVGMRLYEVVDYAIDNHGTPGDALIDVEGYPWRVAPSSTIAGATIWNCLLTEAIFRLREQVDDLPVIASFNMKGAAAHNEAILEKWNKINPHLPNRNIKISNPEN